MKKLFYLFSLLALVSFSSCENGDWSFPDYGTTTVYFAYQYPVRTIVLGNDEVFDNTLDNQHKCMIKATMGGVYENQTSPVVDIEVVNSLCDNLKFSSLQEKTWFLCLLNIIHFLLTKSLYLKVRLVRE